MLNNRSLHRQFSTAQVTLPFMRPAKSNPLRASKRAGGILLPRSAPLPNSLPARRASSSSGIQTLCRPNLFSVLTRVATTSRKNTFFMSLAIPRLIQFLFLSIINPVNGNPMGMGLPILSIPYPLALLIATIPICKAGAPLLNMCFVIGFAILPLMPLALSAPFLSILALTILTLSTRVLAS